MQRLTLQISASDARQLQEAAPAPAMAPAAANTDDGFERLVALHEPRVRRLARRLLGWRGASTVDDIVQDVFLAALKNLSRFRGDASVETWLMRITINRCRSHQRRQLLTLRWLRKPRGEPEASAGADARTLTDETRSRVRAAVAKLPTKEREVVVLNYLEELPVSEIATLLSLSRGAVDVRLHRARRRLKELLGEP